MEKVVRKAPEHLLESGQSRTIRQEFAIIGLPASYRKTLKRLHETFSSQRPFSRRGRSSPFRALIFSVPWVKITGMGWN